MKTYFNNLKKSGTYTPRSLLTSILTASVGAALTLGLLDCSGDNSLFTSGSNARLQLVQVPITMEYKPSDGSSLGMGEGLGLVTTATNLKLLVSGCATGYTFGTATVGSAVSSGVVNLYKTDRNCLVKLTSFDAFGSTYFGYTDGSHEGATPFSAWTNGSVATFSKDTTINSSTPAADLIYVFVTTQVASPVPSSGGTIAYSFTDIAAGTTNTLSQGAVSTAVPLTVQGKAAPNYAGNNTINGGGVAFARFISTNTDGSANMSFTIVCNSAVTGASVPYTCVNSDGSGDIQNVAISYSMVPDLYSTCKTTPTTLTVANANTIFAGSVFTGQLVTAVPNSDSATTSDGSGAAGQIKAAAGDNWGNTGITNGGFDTISMLSGTNPIYSGADVSWTNGYQYLNEILILRRRDASSNTLSYLYYCINIAAITQS